MWSTLVLPETADRRSVVYGGRGPNVNCLVTAGVKFSKGNPFTVGSRLH